MEEKELIDKVVKKLQNRPDMKNVRTEYMNDVIEDCLNDVKDFINFRTEDVLENGLLTSVCDLSVIRINLTGTEGTSSASKAGTSESFLEDIPKSIQRKLRKYRRLPS